MVFTSALRGMRFAIPSPAFYAVSAKRACSQHMQRGTRYWEHLDPWKAVSVDKFNSHTWQHNLEKFLLAVLPDKIGPSADPQLQHIEEKENFVTNVKDALKLAPMVIRITPHIASLVDWSNPLDDPIRRQFLPLRSALLPEHPRSSFDSLSERDDSVCPGLVHRYPGRALFLATSICPVYCRYCTRSYAVGGPTNTANKDPQKPVPKRWKTNLDYIRNDKTLHDIVVSGGDTYYLDPRHLRSLGEQLLAIPHIHRVRFASKGLVVGPGRIFDKEDQWADTLIDLSIQGRKMGKEVCFHTHFNHAREITWTTKVAADKLFQAGVIVRNQTVLLNGVNNSVPALSDLINGLSSININPYYVYQCDLVPGIEDLRTPLRQILDLEKTIRGTISGCSMPNFVIDLPGGGGKRIASTYESYDEVTGISTYRAPGLSGDRGLETYTYYDPEPLHPEKLESFQTRQRLALDKDVHLDRISSNGTVMVKSFSGYSSCPVARKYDFS